MEKIIESAEESLEAGACVERGERNGIGGEEVGREQSKETFPSNTRRPREFVTL